MSPAVKGDNFFYNKFCFFFPLMKGVLPLFSMIFTNIILELNDSASV